MTLLEVTDLHVFYGRIEAIKGVSFTVNEGEIVTLIGANGAGKTTTLRTVSGVRTVAQGSIFFEGEDITKMAPHDRVKRGICQAPEGRGIFPGMTVRENLDMGTYVRGDKGPQKAKDLEHVMHLFPRLRERIGQMGGTLSGGEQQMLAIGRALMSRPKVLLLDEPTQGVDIGAKEEIHTFVDSAAATGSAVVVASTDSGELARLCDRVIVMYRGQIIETITRGEGSMIEKIDQVLLAGSSLAHK